MLISSNIVIMLSQNSNCSLKTLLILSKNIKELWQQIKNEMHTLLNQSLQRFDKIKERLRVKENE